MDARDVYVLVAVLISVCLWAFYFSSSARTQRNEEVPAVLFDRPQNEIPNDNPSITEAKVCLPSDYIYVKSDNVKILETKTSEHKDSDM